MIAFSPTEDQTLMQQGTAQLAKRLRDALRATEKARELSPELRKAAHEMGLGAVALPEAAGGAGLGMTTAVLLEEEIAAGDPAAAFAFGGAGLFGLAVTELGTEAQAKELLAPLVADDGWQRGGAVAWSERRPRADRPGFTTRATPEKGGGFRLDGEKSFVLGATRADRFVVFAQVDEAAGWDGLGAFVVEKGATGVGVGERATTLGLDCAGAGSVRFEGVKLDQGARLPRFENVVRFFTKAALLVAAREVGLARAAFETTRAYCEVRKAFGKPIGHFQAVAFTLADRAMDVEAARALVWRGASAWDLADASPGDAALTNDALLHSAWAISFAHEAAMRCGDDAVQLHGGSGFMRDYPVEKFMRDAKQLQLCVMTAEQADQLAAAITLGVAPSVAAVLPTPETQSTFT